jgi:hypothetical protein
MSAQPRWDQIEPDPRPSVVSARDAHPESSGSADRIVSVIALASIAAGAINAAAAATVARGSAQDVAFFGVVAAAQVVWGVVALVWAPRGWLALGALGNSIVVATWVVSRTVGLPFGDLAGEVLPVHFPDALATILEAVTAAGAAWLAVRRAGQTRAAARARRFTLAAAIVIGALGLAGVLSQSGAFASGGGGNGGQNVPTAPNGGAVNGGGGYGGYGGY